MRFSIIYKKVAFECIREGISAYHAGLYHGRFVNRLVADNHLGDPLEIPLQLEKNTYECRYIFQTQRNLVIPETAKNRLSGLPNIDFYRVVFAKLFRFEFAKGDFSFGPSHADRYETWLKSFRHDGALRDQIGAFYELILPNYDRIAGKFEGRMRVAFNLTGRGTRESVLDLCSRMITEYPIIWSREGIVFADEAVQRIVQLVDWDYFHRVDLDV